MTVQLLLQIVSVIASLGGIAAFFKISAERTQIKEQATNLLTDSATKVATNLRQENDELSTDKKELEKIIVELKTDREIREKEYKVQLEEIYRIRHLVYRTLVWSNHTYDILTNEQKMIVGKPPSVEELQTEDK